MCVRPRAQLRVHAIQATIRIGGEQGRIGGFSDTAFETRSWARGFLRAHSSRMARREATTMKRQAKGCQVVGDQDGVGDLAPDGGRVERVPAVAVVRKDDPSILDCISSLHGSKRDALALIKSLQEHRVTRGEQVPRAIEAVFDGTRFYVVFVQYRLSWAPVSLLDVPPIGNDPGCDGGSEDHHMLGEFMTREDALEFTVEHNRAEERDREDEGCCIRVWAVMVEVGQPVNLKTLVAVEIRGALGEYRQEAVYPVRIAKLATEEIERYKINAPSEEPAAV